MVIDFLISKMVYLLLVDLKLKSTRNSLMILIINSFFLETKLYHLHSSNSDLSYTLVSQPFPFLATFHPHLLIYYGGLRLEVELIMFFLKTIPCKYQSTSGLMSVLNAIYYYKFRYFEKIIKK